MLKGISVCNVANRVLAAIGNAELRRYYSTKKNSAENDVAGDDETRSCLKTFLTIESNDMIMSNSFLLCRTLLTGQAPKWRFVWYYCKQSKYAFAFEKKSSA